jgi:hypothetical protein
MPSEVKPRWRGTITLLAIAAVGALAYMFMPSCSMLADADDTLCHAIAAAKDGVVDWPDYDAEHWRGGPVSCHGFDHCTVNPWFSSQDARAYIEGFGIAQGHNWADLGGADVMSVDKVTEEVDTPLGRTYNAYANIVFANLEGTELDRGRSLSDFEYYDTYLKWSSAYVSQKTYRVNGNCFRNCRTVESSWCVIARTVTGPFRNDFIDLYQTFFYDIDSILRASTIVHEVRHARHGISHDGGGGCTHGSACDTRWSRSGANTYELMWLAAYYYTPEDHPFITPARRQRAVSLFNLKRESGFNEQVLWKLGDFYAINEIPEFYVEEAACSEDPDNPHPCLILAD